MNDVPGSQLPATIYCSLEESSFPASQFYEDESWGLVHRTDQPHTTMGTFIGVKGTETPNAPAVEGEVPGDVG